MQEIPTMQQPPQVQQPPTYPPHPYREYAAWEQQYYGQPYYGPPIPPPKKKMGTGTKWLIGVLIFLVVILGGGTLAYIGTIATSSVKQATSTPTQPPMTVTPTPQPTVSAEDQYKQSAMSISIATLVDFGDQYEGKVIHITGTVQDAMVNDNGISGMIVRDPNTTSMMVIVMFPNGTKMDGFLPGDSIKIWGLCQKLTTTKGENFTGMGAVYWTDTTSGITN